MSNEPQGVTGRPEEAPTAREERASTKWVRMDWNLVGQTVGYTGVVVGAVTAVIAHKATLKQIRDGDHDGYVYVGPTDPEAELDKAAENGRFLTTQMQQVEARLGADTDVSRALEMADLAEKDIPVLQRIAEETLSALRRADRAVSRPQRKVKVDPDVLIALDTAIETVEKFRDEKLPGLVQACAARRAELEESAGS